MRHILQSLIISIAVIAIASPSFAGNDRDEIMWDRDKKEQSHQRMKLKHRADGISVTTVGYSVNVRDNLLYKINMTTGVATPIGPVGASIGNFVDGLSFHPTTGELFGIEQAPEDRLIKIDKTTGAATLVGVLGIDAEDPGLTFDADGNLFMASDDVGGVPASLFSLDPLTGTATLVGSTDQVVTGLTASGGTVYGLGGDWTNNLVTINTATGLASEVGPLVNVELGEGGIDFSPDGVLWGISRESNQTFTIDPDSGLAIVQATISIPKGVFLGLAIDDVAPVAVDIDIKPGNERNFINPRAKGGIWVAILSDTNAGSPFDPSSQVDIPTVEFGPDGAKAIRHKVKDINKDGLGDLLLRFKIPSTGIACGDTEAALIGETFGGQSFTGKDSIRTVGCKNSNNSRKKKHKGK